MSANDPSMPLDLSSNANPLGPSPEALGAMRAVMGGLHHYPDSGCGELKRALASVLDVGAAQIAVGNGSCELLELVVRVLVGPGESVILGRPGFPAYAGVVSRAGARAVMVAARDYRDDLEAMLDRVDRDTRLIVLANPGNPTGTALGRERLLWLLERLPTGLPLVLDEAYREYADAPDVADALELLRTERPVIALRTFSKVHGLAGLRVGYVVGDPGLIARLDAERQRFSTSSLAQAAALAALRDSAHIEATIDLNRRGRIELIDGLTTRGLDPVPSQANFVLVAVGDGEGVTRGLAQRGVLVKALGRYGLSDHIRVSTGLPEDHRRFFAALDGFGLPLGRMRAA